MSSSSPTPDVERLSSSECHAEDGRGDLFVVSAPSGTGKTTLIRRLLAEYPRLAGGLRFSVSHTTRPPRPGDLAGRDYHFVDEARFRQMIAEERFLEWAHVFGRLYGTTREVVEELRDQGCDVLLDIDVQGALQVKARVPEAQMIFILPPSYQELERRLRGRQSDHEEQIRFRLATATREIAAVGHYEYVILNNDVSMACESLAGVFLARRSSRSRLQKRIDRVLATFPPSA